MVQEPSLSAVCPQICWMEVGAACSARWRSESDLPPPRRVVIADARLTADAAYRLACAGTAMLWRGDFQSGRQLLQALARRVDAPRRSSAKAVKAAKAASDAGTAASDAGTAARASEAFHRHRQAQSQRARTLGMVLVQLDGEHGSSLRRAPDLRLACLEAYGAAEGSSVASMRELLGIIGAHEWRKKGVEVAALGERVHPYYGVFAPIRGEYVGLVAAAPLPAMSLAFDIGTGTGVLAAVLARRGVTRVVATDQDARALACAGENITRLGLAGSVEIVRADLFPEGRAPLVVCNPPWIPARPSSPIEAAVYDLEGRMLRGFVDGLLAHLTPGGEGWLILSDIAEHLGLRSRDALLAMFAAAGVRVVGRSEARPKHPRVSDREDPLHAARAAEVTSLWRLAAA